MKTRYMTILAGMLVWSITSCVEVESQTNTDAQTAAVSSSLDSAEFTATPYEIGFPWDIFNEDSTPELIFNVGVEPNDLSQDQSVTAHLHLYEVTIEGTHNCYYPGGGYETEQRTIAYLTEVSQPLIMGRPLVMSLGQLPVGHYSWILTFSLVDESGNASHFPLAEPPQTICELDDIQDEWGSVINDYTGNLSIVPTFDEGTFVEVLEGWNDPDDPTRFNVVYFLENNVSWIESNPGYEISMEEEMMSIARHLTGGEGGGEFGLLSAEPYASNPEAFNFWLYDTPLPAHLELHDGVDNAFGLIVDEQPIENLSLYKRILASVPFDGVRTIPIWIEPYSVPGGGTCGWAKGAIVLFPIKTFRTCMENYNSESHCLDVARSDRVMTHEVAHLIGGADENYFGQELFDPSVFEEFFGYDIDSHFSHWMTYYSPEIDSESLCAVDNGGTIQCYEPNPEAVADCEENASWRDLLGNGCGEPGVIDCDPSDPLYPYEVTCNNLGSGRSVYLSSDLFKATQTSMMDDRDRFLDPEVSELACIYAPGQSSLCQTTIDLQGRVFGEATERQLCVFMEEWTGEPAGGVCEDLCLERCADGQRCINGECIVPDAPGDINADGLLNLVDTQCIILANLATLSGTPMPNCAAELEMGDMDCSGGISQIDIQLSIQQVLACPNQNSTPPFSPAIDANQDGVHDACNDVLNIN